MMMMTMMMMMMMMTTMKPKTTTITGTHLPVACSTESRDLTAPSLMMSSTEGGGGGGGQQQGGGGIVDRGDLGCDDLDGKISCNDRG